MDDDFDPTWGVPASTLERALNDIRDRRDMYEQVALTNLIGEHEREALVSAVRAESLQEALDMIRGYTKHAECFCYQSPHLHPVIGDDENARYLEIDYRPCGCACHTDAEPIYRDGSDKPIGFVAQTPPGQVDLPDTGEELDVDAILVEEIDFGHTDEGMPCNGCEHCTPDPNYSSPFNYEQTYKAACGNGMCDKHGRFPWPGNCPGCIPPDAS